MNQPGRLGTKRKRVAPFSKEVNGRRQGVTLQCCKMPQLTHRSAWEQNSIRPSVTKLGCDASRISAMRRQKVILEQERATRCLESCADVARVQRDDGIKGNKKKTVPY